MSQLDNVSVVNEPNVYYDGKCISYTLLGADGSRKSVGVIFPGEFNFGTAASERMEILGGNCRIRLPGEENWQEIRGGDSFNVAGDSAFDIVVAERIDYVCHYGE